MPRYLTAAVQAALAASGTRVVLLATITQAVPGISRTVRIASMSDGTNHGQFVLGADTYEVRTVSVPSFRIALLGDGGVTTVDAGELAFANPGLDGALWTDTLGDVGPLDGATIDFDLLIGASAAAADAFRLATGFIREPRARVNLITLPWLDATVRESAEWPTEEFEPADYLFADTDLWGTRKPVLFGDLTGKAFDVAAANSAVWPHQPCPLIDGMAQKYFVRDIAAANNQEEIVWLMGVPCTVPAGSKTLSGEYLQLTSNVLDGWLRPHRTIVSTGVDNSGYARSDDVDEYAEIGSGDVLEVGFPGAPDGIGLYSATGTPADADCILYLLMSTASGTGSVEVTISVDGTPVVNAAAVATTTTPTWYHTGAGDLAAYAIGTDLSAIADLQTLTVSLEGVDADATRLHRVLVKFAFRANEVLAGFEQQEVTRSQLGFTESATATDDYQDGGFMDVPGTVQRTTPLANPADVVEAIERNKNWGLGRRAPREAATPFLQYEDPSVTLAAHVGNGTSLTVGSGEDQWFDLDDLIIVDAEVMRVTALPGSDVLTVQRGVAGSRIAFHASGSAVYICPESGEVDTASLRGARRLLSDPDGTELVTNGCMEAFTGSAPSQIATGWTVSDPGSKGSYSAGDGYTAAYAQSIQRTSTGSTNPGMYQALSCASGSYYRVRVRARGVTACTMSIGLKGTSGSEVSWTLSLTTSWQTFDVMFRAWDTTMYLFLRGPTAAATAHFDAVSAQKLQEWAWAFRAEEPRNSRDWYNDALPHAKMRLNRDQFGRTSARVIWPFRPSAETWTVADLVGSVRSPGSRGFGDVEPLEVWRSSDEDVSTGVTVRYGYDEHRKRYLGSTWVGARKESVRQVVESFSGGVIVVDDTAEIYPATGWESRQFISMETSGTDNRTLTFSEGLYVGDEPAFQTNGVAVGSWVFVWRAVLNYWMLTKVAAVNSETSITVADPMWAQTAAETIYTSFSVFPNLFSAGGLVFMPAVAQGPGNEHATDVTVVGNVGSYDPLHFGSDASIEPSVGDTIYRLISYSDDGSGVADQGYLLNADRERWAMQRLAVLGQERTRTVESPYIRDAFTAARLRDHLFDRAGFHYEGTARTSLAKVGLEAGDVVTIVHDLIPGGTMAVELVEQSVDVSTGVIAWRWREVVKPV